MYALAKYANGNTDEILQRIDEGYLHLMKNFSLNINFCYNFRAICRKRAASTTNSEHVLRCRSK